MWIITLGLLAIAAWLLYRAWHRSQTRTVLDTRNDSPSLTDTRNSSIPGMADMQQSEHSSTEPNAADNPGSDTAEVEHAANRTTAQAEQDAALQDSSPASEQSDHVPVSADTGKPIAAAAVSVSDTAANESLGDTRSEITNMLRILNFNGSDASRIGISADDLVALRAGDASSLGDNELAELSAKLKRFLESAGVPA